MSIINALGKAYATKMALVHGFNATECWQECKLACTEREYSEESTEAFISGADEFMSEYYR